MLSFIHAADLHLAAAFLEYPPKLRELIRDYQFKCLENMIDFAIKKKVTAILFAGDLFDDPRPSQDLLTRLEQLLLPLEEEAIAFYLALGNHDAGLDPDRLGPPIVVMDSGEPTIIDFKNWRLVGLSFKDKWDLRKPLEILPSREDRFTLGLFHSGADYYFPLKARDIEELGYDYLALGHVHRARRLADRAYYSGNLSQIDGEGGFLYYTVEMEDPQWISSPAFPIEDRIFILEDLQLLEELENFASKPYKLILRGELESHEMAFVKSWISENPELFVVNELELKNYFRAGPIYETCLEILERKPQLILGELDLLDMEEDQARTYIENHRQDLLIQLEELFRGHYD